MTSPRVSVGMPVYNGERFLAEAIESVLGQTDPDFELVISDNGSTDSTESICRGYAERDTRIRYVRSEENRGATWNFRRVVDLARGEYFRWAAHDDLVDPTFHERCLTELERSPSAVLCGSQVRLIGPDREEVGVYEWFPDELAGDRAARRYRALLPGSKCFLIFGLIRTDVLQSLPPLGAYGHADGVLLARLALVGPFRFVREPIFHHRIHDAQSMNAYGDHTAGTADGPPDYHAYIAWYDPSKAGRLVFPNWRILGEHIRSLALRGVPMRDRAESLLAIPNQVRRERYWLVSDLRAARRGVRAGTTTA